MFILFIWLIFLVSLVITGNCFCCLFGSCYSNFKTCSFFNTCAALLCSLFVLCKHECFKTAPFHRFLHGYYLKKIMERAGHCDHSQKRRLVMKARKHQSRKQRCCGLCSKLPDRAQSFVFFLQIVTV